MGTITEISTADMSREEWREQRRKGIGGSDAGAIVGLNNFKNALGVYLDKIGEGKDRDTEAMRQGRDLEEYVAKRFCLETDKEVEPKQAIIINSDYPWALANVDRLVVGEDAGLECKTTSRKFEKGDYPKEWYVQCQHYMAVTGRAKWYLAVLRFGQDFTIYEIPRDEDDIKALMEQERIFWEENIQKKQIPMPTGTNADDEAIQNLYAQSSDDEVELVGFDKELEECFEIKRKIKELEAEKSKIEQRIKLMMKTASVAQNELYKITWNTTKRRTADFDKLIADGLSEYITESESRRFAIKKKNVKGEN